MIEKLELLKIDAIYSLKAITGWLNSWSIEQYGINCVDPERYLKKSKDGQSYIDYITEPKLRKEKAVREHILTLLLKIREINCKLNGDIGHQFAELSYKQIEEYEHERKSLYSEYLNIVKQCSNTNLNDFICKDCDRVLRFIESELSRPQFRKGKDIATILFILHKDGYINYERKLRTLLRILKEYYPNKIGENKNIEDYLRSVTTTSLSDKKITKEEIEEMRNRFYQIQ